MVVMHGAWVDSIVAWTRATRMTTFSLKRSGRMCACSNTGVERARPEISPSAGVSRPIPAKPVHIITDFQFWQAADTLGFEWSPVLDRDAVRCRNLERLTDWKGRDMPLTASEQALFNSLGAWPCDCSIRAC